LLESVGCVENGHYALPPILPTWRALLTQDGANESAPLIPMIHRL
jgi:hypothetical protein